MAEESGETTGEGDGDADAGRYEVGEEEEHVERDEEGEDGLAEKEVFELVELGDVRREGTGGESVFIGSETEVDEVEGASHAQSYPNGRC